MKISEFGIRNSELLATVCLVLIFSTMAAAGVVEKKAALGGFDGFVERMGAGTRELGRGNTGSADTSAMPGAYWNPAILGFRQNLSYTLNGEKRDLDRTGGSLGIESSVGKRMGIGFAMLYRGDMDFKVIDDDDQTLGPGIFVQGHPQGCLRYIPFHELRQHGHCGILRRRQH